MIPHALSGLSFIERFYSYPLVQSTSDTARALRTPPVKGMYCIQADRQAAGRGRRGVRFFSDSTGGLWVSLVVPMEDPGDHFNFNRALSLAVTLTLDQCERNPPIAIKWPNDIYWGEKKICGIILENHPVFHNVLIIGFGINVNIAFDEFPEELRKIATSVLIETGRRCSLSALLRAMLKQYMVILSSNREKVHELYLRRLYGIGTTIGINGMVGRFSGVAPDGQLLLINNGIPVQVTSGSPVFLDMPDSSSLRAPEEKAQPRESP